LEQYARFSAEANLLRMDWEKSEGTLDIRDKMLAVLAKYNQDPRTCLDEDGNLNYHACGLIPEWHDLINKDAEMLVKYSQLSGEVTRQAMFGGAEGSAGTAVEGVDLDTYAKTCAMLQGKSEGEVPGIVMALGYKDMDHWGRVRDGFNAAMGADTTLKLATHFGELFAKYGQGHMAAATQFSVDVAQEHIEEGEARDKLQADAVKEVMKMAVGGKKTEILPYLKKTFPDDADDADALDWYLDKACDLFGEAGNKDGARAVLEVRHGLRGEDEPLKEWVDHELELLF
jgi:hypothetical protein